MENYIIRELKAVVSKYLFKNKAIILFGSRQTGKTTLVNELINDMDKEVLFL